MLNNARRAGRTVSALLQALREVEVMLQCVQVGGACDASGCLGVLGVLGQHAARAARSQRHTA